MIREQRKLDHIRYALELGDGERKTGLEDIRFLHNCLTPVEPDRVDIRTRIGNLKLPVPVMIDAITGGADRGSVREGQHADTFAVIREENPDGIFFANVSALATPEEARAAVDMIRADALEIHLNVTQELIMPEGDKQFSLIRDNLSRLQDCTNVPIIMKETGCGMAAEQIQELQAMGFSCFNIAGLGGHVAKPWDTVIASGGIRNGWQAALAIALGADAVAMSGNVLTMLMQNGEEAAIAYLQDVIADLKDIMVLTGCRTVRELQWAHLVYTGETMDFIRSRGYAPLDKRIR